jgi:hypothetical protein
MSQYLLEVGFKNGQTYSRYIDKDMKNYIERVFREMWGEEGKYITACVMNSLDDYYHLLGFRCDEVIWLGIREVQGNTYGH